MADKALVISLSGFESLMKLSRLFPLLGMTESLQWIKESLEDCLEERDEETEESVPLVPFNEQLSETVESSALQRLFRAFGFDDPNSEETYWRIPGNMLTATMKKRVQLIDAALKGEFPPEGEIKIPLHCNNNQDNKLKAPYLIIAIRHQLYHK